MSLLPDETLQTGDSPSVDWDRDAASRALDELFSLTRQYKSSDAYRELMKFVTRFRYYSPFNAMLVHVQMPQLVGRKSEVLSAIVGSDAERATFCCEVFASRQADSEVQK